jgi:hypothetical protein
MAIPSPRGPSRRRRGAKLITKAARCNSFARNFSIRNARLRSAATRQARRGREGACPFMDARGRWPVTLRASRGLPTSQRRPVAFGTLAIQHGRIARGGRKGAADYPPPPHRSCRSSVSVRRVPSLPEKVDGIATPIHSSERTGQPSTGLWDAFCSSSS